MRPIICVVALGAFVCGCANDAEPDPVGLAQAPLLQSDDPRYGWLAHPDGRGHEGNACSPSIGFNPACSITAEEDFSCFERAMPPLEEAGLHGEWVKQTIHALHCPNVAACGGAWGDIDVVRICNPAQKGVATICGPTGGAGCAVCAIAVSNCH